MTVLHRCTRRTGAAVLAAMVLVPGLLACSSHPRLYQPPRSPPAKDVEWLVGHGDVRLFSQVVMPAGQLRGVVWLVMGPEIPSALPYPRFRQSLAEAGMACAVVHPRGTGFSRGWRGDIANYNDFLSDYTLYMQTLQHRFPGIPIFLVGHSAGGAFAMEVAARHAQAVTGVILVNPAYKLRYASGMGPSFKDYVVYGTNYVLRPSAITVDMNSHPEAITHEDDRKEAMDMQADPVVVRYFSMRYLFAQKQVMDRIPDNTRASQAPLLIVEGRHDALVDPAGNEELLAMSGSRDKTKVIAQRAGHGSSAVETMTEAIIGWLDARALPSNRAGAHAVEGGPKP